MVFGKHSRSKLYNPLTEVRVLQEKGSLTVHTDQKLQDMVLNFKMLFLVSYPPKAERRVTFPPVLSQNSDWVAQRREWEVHMTEKSKKARLKETAATEASVRNLFPRYQHWVLCESCGGKHLSVWQAATLFQSCVCLLLFFLVSCLESTSHRPFVPWEIQGQV